MLTNGLFVHVPVLVQRPAVAAKTGRPEPLVRAARTAAAGRKRVPDGAASDEIGLGGSIRRTGPQTRRLRTPAAQRAPHTAELIVRWLPHVDRDRVYRPLVFQQQQCHTSIITKSHVGCDVDACARQPLSASHNECRPRRCPKLAHVRADNVELASHRHARGDPAQSASPITTLAPKRFCSSAAPWPWSPCAWLMTTY